MSGEFDEMPQQLQGPPELMPWDEQPPERYHWMWGLDRGKALEDIDSRELVRKRAWLESKMGPGRCYAGLVAEIDRVLTERQGE